MKSIHLFLFFLVASAVKHKEACNSKKHNEADGIPMVRPGADDTDQSGSEADKSMPLIINGKLGRTFENPWPTWKGTPSILQTGKWLNEKRDRETNTPQEVKDGLPVSKPIWQPTPESGALVTWLGHASVLVQIDGFSILTDPILSANIAVKGIFNFERITPPPCSVADLPMVDAVLISHNHHDHLDKNTTRQLYERFGDALQFFIPIGLRAWFLRRGISNVVESTWWNSTILRITADSEGRERSAEIVFLPAQHWSMRNLRDKNKSLWGSWAVIGSHHRFYFAGDTGYCTEFRNIGAHYRYFDISAIPIGCYSPRYAMRNQHIDPAEAVTVHQEVRSKYSLAIHWGTFDMGTTEAPLAPRAHLQTALDEAGIAQDKFFTLNPGEFWQLPQEPAPA